MSPDGSLVLPRRTRVPAGPGDDSYPGMDETGLALVAQPRCVRTADGARPAARSMSSAAPRTAPIAPPYRPTARSAISSRFAERGGESVAADSAGNVYVANGQIFVYDASGRPTGRIDVPERPVQILFGGADRRTLFILTHHALYSVTTRAPGEAGPWGT